MHVFNCTYGSVKHIANVTCAVCRGKQDVSPGVRVGTLSSVIKVYQEMYQNSHVMPCLAI